MTLFKTLAVLFTAALLEAAGDALVQKGLHSAAILRIWFLVAGAAVLFAYVARVVLGGACIVIGSLIISRSQV